MIGRAAYWRKAEGVVAGDEGCVWWKVREMWGEWRRSGG